MSRERLRPLATYLEELASRDLPEPIATARDAGRERRRIAVYLESLAGERIAQLRRFASQHPPMAPDTRLAVLLPARFEEHRIGAFLHAFARESRRAPVELIVLDNRRPGERRDGTADIVHSHPGVLYLEHELDADEARYPIATVRKLLADYALYRAAERPSYPAPLYLLSEDADVEDIDIGRSRAMIDVLDRRPQLDAIRGVQERTREALAANELLLFERRSWYFTEALMSQRRWRPGAWAHANFHWNRVVTGGWNTCFTAEAYAAIGGYSEQVRIFEDMDIGQRISVLRGAWQGGRFVPNVDTVARVPFRAVSSANRAILALVERRHIYDGDGNFAFFFDSSFEETVRRAAVGDLLDRIADCAAVSRDNLHRFGVVATVLLGEITDYMGQSAEAYGVFHRAMWLSGWPRGTYAVGGREVAMLDPAPFRARAAAFRSTPAAKRIVDP